jgi:large subunit ribosomal protein L9
MQVILLERIKTLGDMGQTVNVKPGFARNFLLPEGKALPATEDNIKRFESERARHEAEGTAKKAAAEALASKLAGVSVKLERQASEVGQLYGSIKPTDITNALEGMGFDLPRGSVQVYKPIKTVGDHEAVILLHADVAVKLPVSVSRQSM